MANAVQKKTAAIYVTYNPETEILLASINIIRKQVDHIIIVDNTENQEALLYNIVDSSILTDIELITLNENKGIATALNIGFSKAIMLNCEWVICFDQDSLPPTNIMNSFMTFIEENKHLKIGAIGPIYTLRDKDQKVSTGKVAEVEALINSGCCVNIEAYQSVNGFKDEMFIDAVDTEFSWNLRVNGYKLFEHGDIILKHNLGTDAFEVNLFGKTLMCITNHSAIRAYYRARNSKYMYNSYKDIFPEAAKHFKWYYLKMVIKITLFEQDKIKKLKAIYHGLKDYKNNIMGKYQPHNEKLQ